MGFVHLHRHSEYSRLDGCGTAQQYAEEAARIGQGALALTDHGTLSGALHHIVACKQQKLVPITGVEAYFRPNRKIARSSSIAKRGTCACSRRTSRLAQPPDIVSTAFQEVEDGGGFYQYPCVDWELLKANSEGLACSSACISLLPGRAHRGRRRRVRQRVRLDDEGDLRGRLLDGDHAPRLRRAAGDQPERDRAGRS